MSLSKHINPEVLLQSCKEHPHKSLTHRETKTNIGARAHSSRYLTADLPKYKLPSEGCDPQAAYQLIHDEMDLDGQPNLNFASFVHTWMPDQAKQLCMENISKNLIDQDEYPQMQMIHNRCISMLAHLWHAPHSKKAVGTATTGSSEAIQLGGLAMKKAWQARRKAAGKNIHEPGPNIVMGANAQVALEKFARYFDVEMRLVPVSYESRYCMDPKRAMEYIDENTIGVFVIMGSTYQGSFEDVQQMSDLLDQYEEQTGNFVPIHVDAASGGFIAPFVYPKLVWDFRLPRVVSINTSGHKFGLTYVGCGWIIWRDAAHLDKSLIFELHYLGSVEYSFSLNFSRPAHPIIAQYFNFLSLGFQGYRKIALADLENARLLSRALEKSGYYTVVSDIHKLNPGFTTALTGVTQAVGGFDNDVERYVAGLPVVGFRWTDDFKIKYPHLKQRWVQTLLRAKGLIVPNYELPPDCNNIEILRIVVRESTTADLIDRIVESILQVTEALIKEGGPIGIIDSMHNRHHEKDEGAHKSDDSTKPSGWGKPC